MARRRKIVVFALVPLVATAPAACTSLVGLSNTAPADAAAPETSVPDADADGSYADAGIDATPFCATRVPRPLFCDDFDLSRNLEDTWSQHLVDGTGATSALDTTAFLSPPASARLTVPGGAVGTGMANRLYWGSGVTVTSSLHAECDLRIDGLDSFQPSALVWLGFGPAGLTLQASRSEASILELEPGDGDVPQATTRFAPLAYQRWTHVAMDIAMAGGSASVTVTIDGTAVVTSHTLMNGLVTAGIATLSIGPGYYDPTSVAETDLHFDDVLFDVH